VLRLALSKISEQWAILSRAPLTLTTVLRVSRWVARRKKLSHHNNTMTVATRRSLEALAQPAWEDMKR